MTPLSMQGAEQGWGVLPMGSPPHGDEHDGDGETQPQRAARVVTGRPFDPRGAMTAEASIAGVRLRWSARTEVGQVRSLNEDALLAEPPVFVVADGMGGHDAGEVASALTVTRFRALAEAAATAATTIDLVAYELRNVNGLLREVEATSEARQMGTTVVGVALVDHGGVPTWLAFNVGDSRAYCWADGHLRRISRDHSYVQELVDAGELAPEAAFSHQHRNIITRALGADPTVHPDYWVRPVQPAERFLLCSDGLTSEVPDVDIERLLAADTVDAAVDVLVDRALDAGGHDNVSVIVVDVVAVDTTDEITTKTKPGRMVRPKTVATETAATDAAVPENESGGGRSAVPSPAGAAGMISAAPPPAAATPIPPDAEVIDLVPRPPERPSPAQLAALGPDTAVIGTVPGLEVPSPHEPRPPAAAPDVIQAMPAELADADTDTEDDTP